MTAHKRLPNRRHAETFELTVGGMRYVCIVGRFVDGRIGQLFLSNHKIKQHRRYERGVLEMNQIKVLGCQTGAQCNFDPQRQFGALSNPSCSPTQMSSERGRKKSEINPRKHCESQVDLKDRRRGRYR